MDASSTFGASWFALPFFTLGAAFSIYEGVQRMMNPSAIHSPLVIYLVLAFVSARGTDRPARESGEDSSSR